MNLAIAMIPSPTPAKRTLFEQTKYGSWTSAYAIVSLRTCSASSFPTRIRPQLKPTHLISFGLLDDQGIFAIESAMFGLCWLSSSHRSVCRFSMCLRMAVLATGRFELWISHHSFQARPFPITFGVWKISRNQKWVQRMWSQHDKLLLD